MADARYVIDLILKARDDTQAAIASAVSGIEGLRKAQEQSKRAAQEWGEQYERSARTVKENSEAAAEAQRKLKVHSDNVLDAQIKLEKAAQAHARATQNANFTDAERLKLLKELESAEEKYADALKDTTKEVDKHGNTTKQWREAGARAHAQRIREINEERVATAAKDAQLEQAANAAIARERKLAAERKAAAAEDKRLQEDIARTTKSIIDEIENHRKRQRESTAQRLRRLDEEELQERRRRANVEKAIEQEAAQRAKAMEQEAAQRTRDIAQANKEIISEVEKFRRASRESSAQRLRRLDEEELQERRKRANVEKAIEQEAAQRARQIAEETKEIISEVEKFRRTSRENTARRLDQLNREEMRQREQLRNIARAQEEEERRRLAQLETERERIHRANLQRGRQQQQAEQQLARSREQIQREILRTAEKLAKTDITPQDFRQYRNQLLALRRDLISTGASGRESMTRINEALKQQNASISKAREEWLGLQREQEEAARQSKELANLEREYQQTLRETTRLRQEQARLAGREGVPSEVSGAVDADIGAAMAKLELISQRMNEIDGREINVDVDVDTAMARLQLRALQRETDKTALSFGALVTKIRGDMTSASQSVAGFDNVIRGALSLGATLFLNQILQLAGATAGALMALASSAGMAGAALGGALTAGAAQAIPVLGALAAAISRVVAVTKAVQQANLLRQQTSANSVRLANQEANAADSIRSAQENLANAQRRVVEAQRNVTESRREARRELEELILAEREAELAARGAVLGQEEAQRALRRAIQEGRVSDVSQRQLGVESAALGATRAQRRLTTTRQELGARQAGPAPEVQQAQEQLRDAQRAVAQAERGLSRARRTAAAAGAEMTAAAGKLNFLLGELSGAERRMYRAILRLQEAWRGFSETATEPLIDAFTFGIDRVTALLRQPRIINAARAVSEGMGAQFRRIFTVFTSDRMTNQFIRISRQARENFAPLTTIFLRLSRSLLNIAEAAGPSLNRVIRWVRDLSGQLERATERGRRSGSLGRFFQQGVTHLQAWVRLLGSIGRLFIAIAGPGGGANTGLTLVERMGRAINKLAKDVENPRSSANRFFREFFAQTRRVIDAMGPVMKAIAKEFDLTFNKAGSGSIKGFANFLAEVLIPALGKFMRFLGALTAAFGNFSASHPILAKTASLITALFLAASVSVRALRFIFGPLIAIVSGVVKHLGGLGNVLRGIRGAFARPFALGPLGLVVGIIVLLLKRFGQLDDIWRTIRREFSRVGRSLSGPFNDLKKAVSDLIEVFQSEGGLMPVIGFLVRIVSGVLQSAIEGIATTIQHVLGGAIKVITGIIEVLIGILTLDLGKAFGGFKKIAEGAIEALRAPFLGIVRFFRGIFERAVNAIKDFLGIRSASTMFLAIGNSLIDGLISPFRNLPNTLKNFALAAKDAVVDAFKGLTGAVTGLIDGIPGVFKSVMNFMIRGLNTMIGTVNKITPGPLKVAGRTIFPGIPDIPSIPYMRRHGGPIPGFGGGDRVPALLEPGEHVLTKEEVSRAGGHGMIFALRAFLGGGRQGGPHRFQEGGRVGAPSALVISFRGGDMSQFLSRWGQFWTTLLLLSRRGSLGVGLVFRQMRVAIEATMGRLERRVGDAWSDMTDHMRRRLRVMVRNVTTSLGDIQNVVFRGMRYVGTATNQALRAFEAKPISLNIAAPRAEGRAHGGFVGQPGERGRDMVPTVLGRGEAVLNWGHQKVVNSALWNQYGMTLDELFRRNRGFHAGGQNAPGHARGGFIGGIDGAGEGFMPLMRYLGRRWGPLNVISGLRPGSLVQGTGRLSNHASGNAVDIAYPGLVDIRTAPVGDQRRMDSLASFLRTRVHSRIGLDHLWRTMTGGNHYNHIHQGIQAAYAHSVERMRRFIATLPEGGDFDSIKRILVRGTAGPARQMLQKMLDQVRGAASKYIDRKSSEGYDMPGMPDSVVRGSLARERVQEIFQRAFQIAGVPMRGGRLANLMNLAWEESAWRPGVTNTTAAGRAAGVPQGILQVTIPTFNDYKLPGYGNPFNPLHNAIASIRYQMAKYGRIVRNAPYATGGYVGGKAPELPQFAKGGVVPGPDGEGVPVLAHAGEWILNRFQQSKLAALLGMGTGKLRSFLGFTGGPTSFQGGGEVRGEPRFFSLREHIEMERFERRMAALKGKNRADERREEEKLNRTRIEGIRRAEARERERFARRTPEQQRISNIGRGAFELSTTPAFNVEIVRREIRRFERAQRALRITGRNFRSRLSRFITNIERLTEEGGLLEQMGQQIDRIGAETERRTNLARAGFRRAGRGMRGLLRPLVRLARPLNEEVPRDAVRLATMEIEGLDEQREAIRSQRNTAVRGLQQVQQQIARIRRGGVSRAERDQYQKLLSERQNLIAAINGADDAFAQNMIARNEALRKRFEAETSAQLAGGQRGQRIGEFFERWAGILGAPVAIINQTIAQRIAGQQQQLEVLRQRSVAAMAAGYEDLARQLEEQAAEVFLAIQEGTAQQTQNLIEEAGRVAESRMRGLDWRRRTAQAFGRGGAAGFIQEEITNLQQEQIDLRPLLARAQAEGNVGLARSIQERIDEINVAISEKVAEGLQAFVEEVNAGAARRETLLGIRERVANALGNRGALAKILQERIDGAERQIEQLRPLLEQAIAENNVGMQIQLQDQIAELQASIVEGTANLLNQAVEDMQSAVARREALLGIRERIASVLGNRGALAQILQDRIDGANQQIEALRGLLTRAVAEGNIAIQTQLQDQISELQTTIVEGTANLLTQAIEGVEQEFSRRETRLGLRERLTTIQERMGRVLPAAQARLGILTQRGVNLAEQRAQVEALRLRAALENNVGVAETLTDQIADLDVQIQENTLAISEQIVATRQVSIDLIQSRQQFQGGTISALQGIITSIGTLTGQLDVEGMRRQLQRLGNLLGQTGTGLREQLQSGFGIDLRGRSGMSLVEAITGLDFDALMSQMTLAQREQFQGLINAILENEQAVIGNTQALQDLNGTMQPQQFQSSAWQWFREAIFTGMGEVLPQFRFPQAQSGGQVRRGGLVNLHPGEIIVRPDLANRLSRLLDSQDAFLAEARGGFSSLSGPRGLEANLARSIGRRSTEQREAPPINIEINEAGGPVDVSYLANRIAFERKVAM